MGDILKIAELAKRYETTPQKINKYVREGLECHTQKPRTINTDVYDLFVKNYGLRKTLRRSVRADIRATQGKGFEGAVSSAVLDAFTQQNKVMAWNRSHGRGWALAKGIAEKSYPKDDFLILENHLGEKTPATESKLIEEAKAGELFFISPDEAIHFIAQQMYQISVDEERDNTQLVAKAIKHLTEAYKLMVAFRELYMIEQEEDIDGMVRRMRLSTLGVSKDEIDALVEEQLGSTGG